MGGDDSAEEEANQQLQQQNAELQKQKSALNKKTDLNALALLRQTGGGNVGTGSGTNNKFG